MRKTTKFIVLIALILLFCSIALCSCSKYIVPNYDNIHKYNATLYNPDKTWFNVEFLSNATEQSYIVSDQAEFEEMFREFPATIDFDRQILLIHWETSQIGHPFELKDVQLRDKTVNIKFGCDLREHNRLGSHTASHHQIFIAVILDAIDIENVQFSNVG